MQANQISLIPFNRQYSFLHYVSVSIYTDYDFYALFDSHQRNNQGAFDSNGQAVLLLFTDMDELLAYILSMYETSLYELTPIICIG